MEKITVIGFTSSGKTCYLAGMYDTMSYGVKNFSLIEQDSDQDRYLQKLWENISSAEGREWPVPNDDKRSYTFSLCHSFEPVMEFEWADYPGAALVDPGMGLLEDLKSQLKDSACLLVLINGESFAYSGNPAAKKRIAAADEAEYCKMVKKNLRRNNDLIAVKKLSEIGVELKKSNQHLPPIALVVTKSDLIEDRWIDCVRPIIHESFEIIFGKDTEKDRLVMVTAVTLGEDIEEGKDADPVDIELPIVYAVLAMVCGYIKRARDARADDEKELNEKDTFWGRLLNSDELEELRRNVSEMETKIQRFSKDAFRLLDLFDNDAVIYINGEKRKLRGFFENQIRG